MNQYKSIATLKGEAKTHMYGKYGTAISAYIFMKLTILMLTMFTSSVVPDGAVGQILYYAFFIIISLISGVFTAGYTFLYLNIASGNPVQSNMIFYGFRNCAEKAIILQGVLLGLEFVACLPLILVEILRRTLVDGSVTVFFIVALIVAVVGTIVVHLFLMPAFFLLHDFPNYTPQQIIKTSLQIMKGNVGRLFMLYLSIVPLQLLEVLSFGIGALWVETYKYETLAEFFLDLMNPAKQDAI